MYKTIFQAHQYIGDLRQSFGLIKFHTVHTTPHWTESTKQEEKTQQNL